MKLFELTKIPLLGKALDAYALRQRVTADNLANVDTLGYRSKTVLFEEELNKAVQPSSVQMAVTNKNHLVPQNEGRLSEGITVTDAAKEGGATTDPAASGSNDVDIDVEMATLADTQLRFKFASRLIAETFRGIQKSIRGQV